MECIETGMIVVSELFFRVARLCDQHQFESLLQFPNRATAAAAARNISGPNKVESAHENGRKRRQRPIVYCVYRGGIY